MSSWLAAPQTAVACPTGLGLASLCSPRLCAGCPEPSLSWLGFLSVSTGSVPMGTGVFTMTKVEENKGKCVMKGVWVSSHRESLV